MAPSRALPLLACLAVVACGPAPVIVLTPDGGPDAGMPDAYRPPPIPYACDEGITHLDGVMGETASITFDTTTTPERPRDLGPACGNVATTAEWPRQEIIEYVVPGTGPVAVAFDTRFPETPENFNTLVQVRTSCEDVPTQVFPPTCFDDRPDGPRAHGAIRVNGGDTLYFVVTGYGDPPTGAMQVSEGSLRIDVTPIVGDTLPSIDAAQITLVGMAAAVRMEITDPDGPPLFYGLGLVTARGRVDFNGDGAGDAADLVTFELDDVLGTGPYEAGHEITPTDDGYQIAAFCRAVTCTSAILVVLDENYGVDTEMSVPIREGSYAGGGQACDITQPCLPGLLCDAGFCG